MKVMETGDVMRKEAVSKGWRVELDEMVENSISSQSRAQGSEKSTLNRTAKEGSFPLP